MATCHLVASGMARQRQARIRALDTAHRVAAEDDAHDRLLQDIQGLTLSLQAITEGIPDRVPARVAIERLLEQLDDVLAESRDRRAGRASQWHGA